MPSATTDSHITMATTHYVTGHIPMTTRHVPMTTRHITMTTRHFPMTTRSYSRTHRHFGTLMLLISICFLLVLIPSTRGRTVSTNNKTSHPRNQLHPGGVNTGSVNVTSEPPGGGDGNHSGGGEEREHEVDESNGIIVAGWNWHHVHQPFVITLVLIAAAILKLGFHHAGRLPQFVPESCVLIILGVIVGGILYAARSHVFADLTPSFFFLVLLPPIILESSYSLYDRVFFDNLGTILLYAVVGTILNCFLIGPVLYGLACAGAMGPISITFIQCLVFASLIVAVDPVAVLAIFQEIGVNNVLYFLVFGESLLNDAVTVVLYNMMKEFNKMSPDIPVGEIFKGIASFFTISLLGMLIGIFYGILTALFTKYTAKVRVVEPLAVFTLAYASYLTADLFMFSGIISIFSCGLTQAHFSFHNVSHKSCTTILYFSKIMSTTCDCIIFMFLGLALWDTKHFWHTGFVIWTIVLCLVFRFVVVYFLTYLANKMKRIRKIDYEEQFIMAYGGLRGAVAFSLVAMLEKKSLNEETLNMFETTTLVVVLFTVFVQGMTIKPLVKLLRIRKQGEKVVSLCDEITNHVTDHLMAGIEEVIGYSGRNRIREILDYYDDKYFKRFLQRSPMTKDEHIMELYKEIAIQDHYDSLASNVDMCRYSSQMVLYHGKADEEDDAFIAMAQTNPELADLALDTTLQRRSTVTRGYYYPNRPRAKTTPSRMFSDPGPDYPHGVVHDVEAVGYPRKMTSLDSEPQPGRDRTVSIQELRKMFVKPTSEMHQKHDRNILEHAEPDLVRLLHEKQLRTTRYLRSISMSMTPESGSPANNSPTDSNRQFVFPRLRAHTAHPAPRLYRRSYTGGGRTRYDSDGPVMAYRHRTNSESTSPAMSVPLKYRSSSMGAVSNPGNATPPLDTIAERNGGSDNNNEEPHRRKPHSASVSSAGSAPNGEDIDGGVRGRRLLSRQDKVRDISPSKKTDSRNASPANRSKSRDLAPLKMSTGGDVTDTVVPEVLVQPGADEDSVMVEDTAL